MKIFFVIILAPPILDRIGIQEIEAVVGEFVILTCKVLSGSGKLITKWIIDGEEVKNGQINPNILVFFFLLYIKK